MYLTAENADAWACQLDDALSQRARLTTQQQQFLAGLRANMKQNGPIFVTARQLASMRHLVSHAVLPG